MTLQLGRPKKDAHHGKPCDSEESEDFPLTLGTSAASETEEGNLRSTRSEYPPQQQQLSTIADPHHGRHYELEEREEGRMDPRVWVGEAGESPHPRPRPSHRASSRPLPSAMGHTPCGERTTVGFNSSQTRSAPFGLQHPRSRPRAAIACVCRDSFGMIRDGFAKHIEVSSAEQAEAVALVETLDFISSTLIPKSPEKELIFLSDCRLLVDSVLSSSILNWLVDPLVDWAKHKLKTISGLSLAHCNRNSNRVADWVAKAHRFDFLPINWVSSPPSALLDLLCTDALDVLPSHSI